MADADRLELLSAGNGNIAGIAAKIGHESEPVFRRAFKKMIGLPPLAWRLGNRTPGGVSRDGRT